MGREGQGSENHHSSSGVQRSSCRDVGHVFVEVEVKSDYDSLENNREQKYRYSVVLLSGLSFRVARREGSYAFYSLVQ